MGTSASPRGLSSAQARALLDQVGPNAVPEERPSVLVRAVRRLWAPVPWMLEATIVLELALAKWLEAGIVGSSPWALVRSPPILSRCRPSVLSACTRRDGDLPCTGSGLRLRRRGEEEVLQVLVGAVETV
ncbi:Cation transporter/ATPase, N-terminus [Actinopolymorpha cephalotaxi]|uniref:Cation transporter/ATPase, N-terminus n=2 Tax=Actinopolymorpha cephalotaxi TaxID=504797 RepID=A0A1I3C1X0_9ACTN|nr:hypothetical protein [Actinopolymorpha cephalotaxi]SFH68534.1 Cation transporter/ATPase, N-terminus [Actinopolymorpha cephalotaxi]